MAYLPGVEVNHDHEGGSSRMRLSHCTSGQLTPTMVSNVDHLNAQFLLVGDCVRASPKLDDGCQATLLKIQARPSQINWVGLTTLKL